MDVAGSTSPVFQTARWPSNHLPGNFTGHLGGVWAKSHGFYCNFGHWRLVHPGDREFHRSILQAPLLRRASVWKGQVPHRREWFSSATRSLRSLRVVPLCGFCMILWHVMIPGAGNANCQLPERYWQHQLPLASQNLQKWHEVISRTGTLHRLVLGFCESAVSRAAGPPASVDGIWDCII